MSLPELPVPENPENPTQLWTLRLGIYDMARRIDANGISKAIHDQMGQREQRLRSLVSKIFFDVTDPGEYAALHSAENNVIADGVVIGSLIAKFAFGKPRYLGLISDYRKYTSLMQASFFKLEEEGRGRSAILSALERKGEPWEPCLRASSEAFTRKASGYHQRTQKLGMNAIGTMLGAAVDVIRKEPIALEMTRESIDIQEMAMRLALMEPDADGRFPLEIPSVE